jgi:hypothetical protein
MLTLSSFAISASRRFGARRPIILLLSLATGAVAPRGVSAQGVTVVGMVVSDSIRQTAVASAQVSIPALTRTTRTTWMGEFRLDGIPAGRYIVLVQAAGFASVGDSIVVTEGKEARVDFVLTKKVPVLDSVVTTAKAAPAVGDAPWMREIAERKKQGVGYFVMPADLRADDSRKLPEVLSARLPGVRLIRTKAGHTYLASGRERKQCEYVFLACTQAKPLDSQAIPDECYVTVYRDGILLYDLKALGSTSPPPDFGAIDVDQLGGIEFYPSGATAPGNYRDTGCGLVLLWSRDR